MSSVGETIARKRLETVWKTLQPYLTEEVCEEVLEVLQVVTAKAIDEKKRVDLRRLSNINALEQLQKIAGAEGETCFLLVCAHALYSTFTVMTSHKPSLKPNKAAVVVGLASEEPKQRGGRVKRPTAKAVDAKGDAKGDKDTPKKRGRPKSSKLSDGAKDGSGEIVKTPEIVTGITVTKRGPGRPKKLK
jgi:hypothetical protein